MNKCPECGGDLLDGQHTILPETLFFKYIILCKKMPSMKWSIYKDGKEIKDAKSSR